MPDNLNSKTFSEHLHTSFRVPMAGANPARLELVEVVESNASPAMEQFSVFFLGPPTLGQGICSLEHDQMGSFDLFLVPVAAEGDHVRYEAAFNRFRKKGE
jgi:hypothetical protein